MPLAMMVMTIKGEIETTLVEGADRMYELLCLFKSLTADIVIKGSDGSSASWTL
jgi:hypothetical protein